MGVRGTKPSEAFGKLAKTFAEAQPELVERMLKAAAAEALTQVQLEFRKGVDPQGRPWAPLKYRKGKPLRDTGRLANSFTSRIATRGFVIGTNVDYFIYHQRGTRGRRRGGIPMRQMLPEPEISERWKRAIERASELAMQRFFAERR